MPTDAERSKKYQQAHPERFRETQRRYREKWAKELSERARAKYARDPEAYREMVLARPVGSHERRRDMLLRYNYGIGVAEYDAMHSAQKGLCAICGQPETLKRSMDRATRRLAVDHCHSSGKVRGLLCSGCNTGLGGLHDDVQLLQKAINYLNSARQS